MKISDTMARGPKAFKTGQASPIVQGDGQQASISLTPDHVIPNKDASGPLSAAPAARAKLAALNSRVDIAAAEAEGRWITTQALNDAYREAKGFVATVIEAEGGAADIESAKFRAARAKAAWDSASEGNKASIKANNAMREVSAKLFAFLNQSAKSQRRLVDSSASLPKGATLASVGEALAANKADRRIIELAPIPLESAKAALTAEWRELVEAGRPKARIERRHVARSRGVDAVSSQPTVEFPLYELLGEMLQGLESKLPPNLSAAKAVSAYFAGDAGLDHILADLTASYQNHDLTLSKIDQQALLLKNERERLEIERQYARLAWAAFDGGAVLVLPKDISPMAALEISY